MKNLRYVTGDLVSPLANSRFDLTAIPIANDAIDVVVCNHVLEHVADDSLAIRELFRVMKPGGWGILQVPVDPDRQTTYENRSITTTEDRTRHFGQSDHVRLYGVDYPVRLGAAGFEVTVVDYRKGFAEDQIKCFGLNQVEAIYLCVKPYRACA